MNRSFAFRRHAGVAAVAVALAFLAGGPALGAPGGGTVGGPAVDRPVGDLLTGAGVGGSGLLPHMPLDTTHFVPCPAEGRCTAGPYHVSGSLSFGIIPVYEGSVTLSLRGPGGARPLFTCTMPGVCPLLWTGGTATGSLTIIGDAEPGSVGEYVLWVTYG